MKIIKQLEEFKEREIINPQSIFGGLSDSPDDDDNDDDDGSRDHH